MTNLVLLDKFKMDNDEINPFDQFEIAHCVIYILFVCTNGTIDFIVWCQDKLNCRNKFLYLSYILLIDSFI
jgi:hypothetical protein